MTVLEKIIEIAKGIGEKVHGESLVGKCLNETMNTAVKLFEIIPFILLISALYCVIRGVLVYEKHKVEGKGFVVLSLATLFLYGCFSEKIGFTAITLLILSAGLEIIGKKMIKTNESAKEATCRM